MVQGVASRSRKARDGGMGKIDRHRWNLAELFRPPHDILFTGTFHEVWLFLRLAILVGNLEVQQNKDLIYFASINFRT